MTVRMAQNRQAPAHYVKQELGDHHSHQQQGPPASQQTQYSRTPSIVQQHHQQASAAAQPHPGYPSTHTIYQAGHQTAQATSAQHSADGLQYYPHASPYSTPGATSGYTSADTSEMMAAAQMPRHPYPPMSYHTPQSNSPASVASSSQHDQHRMYGQAPSQTLHQSMYYGAQQAPYQSMATQPAAASYAQHAQHAQHAGQAQHQHAHPHQPMTSQPAMMMAQTAPQHQLNQHATQHAQAGMTSSPRHKVEPQTPLQLQKPQPAALQQTHPNQNGSAPLSTPTSAQGINPNAAPGPIPATTPLVVRQDQNGVQWIAFEYSRDRVKMEYTIRCDVESVNTDELSQEFKTDNCVYPRACCPKDQYRGNRQVYETECNTVGWALAQLNPPLRGKRGLIQRAVDSWRNSNQDPRLRSRRVRRMAKMTNRKAMQGAGQQSPHIGGPAGMPGAPGTMGAGGPGVGKPGMGMPQPMHHHAGAHPQDHGQGGGDEVGDDYSDDQHHHHQAPVAHSSGGPATDDLRPSHVFTSFASPAYPQSASSGGGMQMHHPHGAVMTARRSSQIDNDDPADLFPNLPEGKKRKFILVEDTMKSSRLRVRVTLDGVNTKEIPDSFRKGSSVFPRSYFPREMQSPPPSATGSRFFLDDYYSDGDDGIDETEGRGAPRRRGGRTEKVNVQVPLHDGQEVEVVVPRMRRAMRGKEVRLNDLGYRMAWLQSRVFAGRTVFLQRALDCYRNKTRSAMESVMQDVRAVAPHYETRPGKRMFNDRMRRGKGADDE